MNFSLRSFCILNCCLAVATLRAEPGSRQLCSSYWMRVAILAMFYSMRGCSACNLRSMVGPMPMPIDRLSWSLLLFSYFIKKIASPYVLLNSPCIIIITIQVPPPPTPSLALHMHILLFGDFNLANPHSAYKMAQSNAHIGRQGLTYINQGQLLKLRMKRFAKNCLARDDVYSQTCIGDSDSLSSPRRSPKSNRRFKKVKGIREASQPLATQIRLFRFRLKHTRKTLRIQLFEQELLNLPLRFTRKTNPMEADNDVETDEEMACNQADRCRVWLIEAVAEQQRV